MNPGTASTASATPVVIVESGASQPTTIDASLLLALDRVVVRQEHDGPATFQLIFNADETQEVESDLQILAGGAFATGNRVRIGLQMGTLDQYLIDGVATFQELIYGEQSGSFTIAITGEDLSVFMRLSENAVEWPGRSSAQIVTEIINNYAQYGLSANVTTPQNDVTPDATLWVRQQIADDLRYVRSLARPFGYIFALQCGATTSSPTTAYWGPPPRTAATLPALRLGSGTGADVRTISFSYDASAAETFTGGSRADTMDGTTLAVTSATTWPLTALAQTASIAGNLARKRQFISPQDAGGLASSSVDGLMQRASRGAARAQARIDGLAYGSIVSPAQLIEVGGAGATFDGNYYVEAVEHELRRGTYRQTLTLSREGLGSTVASSS
jgi:phage protein D